jgi:hypothetical protein
MLTEVKIKRARSSNSFVSVIISWLGLKNLFQTLDLQDPAKIEQEIQEVRELLDETDDMDLSEALST